jgi:hypothetical protein
MHAQPASQKDRSDRDRSKTCEMIARQVSVLDDPLSLVSVLVQVDGPQRPARRVVVRGVVALRRRGRRLVVGRVVLLHRAALPLARLLRSLFSLCENGARPNARNLAARS